MAHVKLDSPVKVFVVFAALDSLEQLAMKVMYIEYFVHINFGKFKKINLRRLRLIGRNQVQNSSRVQYESYTNASLYLVFVCLFFSSHFDFPRRSPLTAPADVRE